METKVYLEVWSDANTCRSIPDVLENTIEDTGKVLNFTQLDTQKRYVTYHVILDNIMMWNIIPQN